MNQKKFFVRFIFFAALFAGAAYLFLSFKKNVVPSSAAVAVTSTPIHDIVRRVAGPDIPVSLIAPAGANPHTYEPPPSALRALAETKLVFAIGHGIDDWIENIVVDTEAKTVIVDEGILLREPVESPFEDEEAGHAEGGVDPHYWLTLPNAKAIASTVARELSLLYPEERDAIEERLAGYLEELDAADAKMRDELAALPNRKMVTLHDAWYYFAESYDLEIVGTFEPSAGREPTPQYLAALSDAVAVSGATVLYAEPGAAVAGLESFLRDHGLTVVELDPVEGASTSSYVDIMLRNAQTIAAHQ